MPNSKIHSYIPELKRLYRSRRITRREFLRYASLLGVSFISTPILHAFGMKAQSTGMEDNRISASGSQNLTVATNVASVSHPAAINSVAQSNWLRQVAEYLTYTDGNGQTHPYLLQSWQVSQDLLTWTLNLRQGIQFNNGDDFTADDVVFSMQQWLDESVGSSMRYLMDYLSPTNIQKINTYTVQLHLDRAEIAVPEHLFHYPALILNHRTFEGDFISAPHGTGPYSLQEFVATDHVTLVSRNNYWQDGQTETQVTSFDQVTFDHIEDVADWITAIKVGTVDLLDPSGSTDLSVYQDLYDDSNLQIIEIPTANVYVLRMRADQAPWTDNRVRTALKLCQDRSRILNASYEGQGQLGHDCHVAPVHPEYCTKAVPDYNPTQAASLLADAGYPSGLNVELAVGGWPEVVDYALTLKADAAAGGFDITLNTMTTNEYWSQWTEWNLGITPWSARPLGTMALNLAYEQDDQGDPVVWNESRWVDNEFSNLLQQANGTLDIEQRRTLFCQLEQIQMDRGSIGIAFWRNVWVICRKGLQIPGGHPSGYLLLNGNPTPNDNYKMFLPLVMSNNQ